MLSMDKKKNYEQNYKIQFKINIPALQKHLDIRH